MFFSKCKETWFGKRIKASFQNSFYCKSYFAEDYASGEIREKDFKWIRVMTIIFTFCILAMLASLFKYLTLLWDSTNACLYCFDFKWTISVLLAMATVFVGFLIICRNKKPTNRSN